MCLSRTGIVMGQGGGMLAGLLPLFRLGLGGVAGSGRQWVSWIPMDDLVDRFIEFMRVPGFAMRLLYGELAHLYLTGQRVPPVRLRGRIPRRHFDPARLRSQARATVWNCTLNSA